MKAPIGVVALILICTLALTPNAKIDRSVSLPRSPAVYDETVSYTTYDPIDLAYDADRNVIWMANHYVAGLSKIDFTSMALIANVSFPASMEPYRVVYDGTSVWILTAPDTHPPGNGAPASIIKVNPDTLAWTNYTFPNDAGHMFGCALAIAHSPTTGGEYIFAGLGSNSTNYHAYVERIDPIAFPNNISEVDLRNTGLGHYDTQCREIIYDGSTIWVSGDAGRIYTVNIDSMNTTYVGRPVTISIFSGSWDGEYLWWGLNNGSIIKMNHATYTFVLMNLQNAIGLIHRWAYDGNGYMWTFDYTSGYVYIINCATMEYRIFATKFASPHAILYAGNYIWIADNTTESAPAPLARLSRYYLSAGGYEFNYCLDFNGINSSVVCGYSQIFDLHNITVEAWVNPQYDVQVGSDGIYGHDWGTIVHHRPSTYDAEFHGWWIGFSYDSGSLDFHFSYDFDESFNPVAYHTNKTTWYSDTWYDIAVTYDPDLPNGNIKFYINGTLDSEYDLSSHPINDYEYSPLQIGIQNGTDPYAGLIDELRIWNYSRSASEIQTTMQRVLNSSEVLNPNLVGYWRFDEGNGTTTRDYSIQKNDGVLGPDDSTTAPKWYQPGVPIIPEFSQLTIATIMIVIGILTAIFTKRRTRRTKTNIL